MKMLLRFAVTAMVGILSSATTLHADEFDGIRDSIRQRMLEERVPAIAVAVWRDGRIVWEQGFGWADRERRIAATEHTPFNIASLTKTMTGVGLMTLVQAGKVDLDQPVNDYLGPDPIQSRVGDPRAVTVRQVANHTSGLPPQDSTFYGEDIPKVPTLSQTIQRYGIVMQRPGERYNYSNLGFAVLGRLIGQVSGKSYADYMRQEVFLPLGMTRSSVDVAPGLEAYRARGYDFDRNPIPDSASADPAAGSVFSSAHDIARFGMFLLKNHPTDQAPILNDRFIDRLSSDPIPTSATNGYAVAINVTRLNGYRVLGHSGSSSGVHSDFVIVPERNLGVLVMANADGGAGDLRHQILTTLLPDWRKPAPAARVDTTFKPTAAMTGLWQGKVETYEGSQPIQLKILASGDIHVRIGAAPAFANRSTLRQDALVNEVAFKAGTLTGTTLARIETSDTRRHPHTVSLNLRFQGDKLSGTAFASSTYDEGLWIYTLPYWTELTRIGSL